MKKLLSFSLALVLLGAGCGGAPEASREANQPNPPANTRLARPSVETNCLNKYFPTTVGQSITYKTTYAGKSDSFTQRIKDVRADGVSIEMSFPAHPGILLGADYVCDGSMIKAKGYADFSSVLTGSKLKMETISSEGVFLPANLDIGTEWSSAFKMKGSMEIAGEPGDAGTFELQQAINIKQKVEKKERITVQTGTYNAIKIKQDTTVAVTVAQSPFSVPSQEPITTSGYVWFVEGLGMVKSESTFNGQSTLVEAESIQMP